MENLLASWQEFLRGKRKRKDVAEFSLNFSDNIFTLHRDLADKTYQHGGYQAFKINDPKPRDIHKATVRDRLVHHAIYRILYPHFDHKFIFDSYSCRIGKGTHKAINRFRKFANIVSKNNTKTCWILKGDIRKFFANIDHGILKNILAGYIIDENVLWLLSQVIESFTSPSPKTSPLTPSSPRHLQKAGQEGGLLKKEKESLEIGLPLGNLTSQLFVNIYMNELDQFVKRKIKIKHYIRYADDFVIFANDKIFLEGIIPLIAKFLKNNLKLELHPSKVFIKTLASSVDFLGWVHFPKHRVLRTSTKRRMIKRIRNNPKSETINSYLGLLKHGNTYKLFIKNLKKIY